MSGYTDFRPEPISTPCTGVCRLDAAGLCLGCRRSIDEIVRWRTLERPSACA